MTLATLPSLALFLTLALVFLLSAAANASILVAGLVRRGTAASERHASMVPLVGGLAGAAACLVAPFPTLRPYFWVPLVTDAGTAFHLAALVVLSLREAVASRRRRSRSPAQTTGAHRLSERDAAASASDPWEAPWDDGPPKIP